LSRRYHTVSVTTDVDIDMSELDVDDLIEELDARKVAHSYTKTEIELQTITDRHFEEVRRSVTQGRKPTENEVDFWWHAHGKQL
jgi:hypothetical protein